MISPFENRAFVKHKSLISYYLVPAITYKEEITQKFQSLYYTTDMFYETASVYNWCPEISNGQDGVFQYAIIDSFGEVKGYFGYYVDYYVSKAYNFGLISFDKGNIGAMIPVCRKMKELISRFHRVEWRVVCGNPAERTYDRFVKKYNGKKFILTDAIRDKDGNYRNDAIYEIINEDVK